MRSLYTALPLMILGCWGCQLALDVEQSQCEADADCVGLLGRGYTCNASGICLAPRPESPNESPDGGGPRLPERWRCLEEAPPEVPADPERSLRVGFDVVDYTTLQSPPDMTVKACAPTDVTCSQPLDEDGSPDADGYVEFEVPHGFRGYFEITAPPFLPSLSIGNRPLYDDERFQGPSLVTETSQMDLAGLGAESIDPERGTAIIEVFDCDIDPGVGVRLERRDGSDERAFYFDGALPDRELEATVISTVLGRGGKPRAVGGFSNVEPGFVTFDGYLADEGDLVGDITVQIRPGHVTYIRLNAGY